MRNAPFGAIKEHTWSWQDFPSPSCCPSPQRASPGMESCRGEGVHPPGLITAPLSSRHGGKLGPSEISPAASLSQTCQVFPQSLLREKLETSGFPCGKG